MLLFESAIQIHDILLTLCVVIAKKSKYKGVHEAVKSGDVKALESMVKEGASVNEIDDSRDRFTPLHWAACTGALEVRGDAFFAVKLFEKTLSAWLSIAYIFI